MRRRANSAPLPKNLMASFTRMPPKRTEVCTSASSLLDGASSTLDGMAKRLSTQERLRIVLRAEGVPEGKEPSGLAKLAGISRQLAWNWLNEKPDFVIDAKAAFTIEDKSRHHFQARWILTGEEPRTLEPPEPEAQEAIDAMRNAPAEKRRAAMILLKT